MKNRVLLLIGILIFASRSYCQTESSACTTESCSVLFIGSSYFMYNNLPNLFRNLAENSDKIVYIERHTRGGLFLYDHASNALTESLINSRNWDYIVLQGIGAVTAYPDIYTHHPVSQALVTLRNMIQSNCSSTKMVFCMPWAFEDGMTFLDGWTDQFADMQNHIYTNTLNYSNQIGFIVAPVGWAWYTVLEEKNYPLHYLHSSDRSHPSLKGSYLMACVIYSTIFQESTTDNSYYGGLPQDEADYFQTVASSTVLDNLELWNIPTETTDIGETTIPKGISLDQNFPNPFHSSTTINFEIQIANDVEISVYDMLGNKCKTLVKEYKLPGKYFVMFERILLPDGIYFYTMKCGDKNITKKMVVKN